jgi:hypothetical protein
MSGALQGNCIWNIRSGNAFIDVTCGPVPDTLQVLVAHVERGPYLASMGRDQCSVRSGWVSARTNPAKGGAYLSIRHRVEVTCGRRIGRA